MPKFQGGSHFQLFSWQYREKSRHKGRDRVHSGNFRQVVQLLERIINAHG